MPQSQSSVAAVERREAVAEALVRPRRGLEPSPEGLALLEAMAAGEIDAGQALDRLRQHYRR